MRAVYDDIMATRKTDWINNFWKAIAHDPATLKRTWESLKEIMGPGRNRPAHQGIALRRRQRHQSMQLLHRLTHRGGARKKGMTDAMYHELQAIIAMANETNKLVTGYQVEIDEQFKSPLPPDKIAPTEDLASPVPPKRCHGNRRCHSG